MAASQVHSGLDGPMFFAAQTAWLVTLHGACMEYIAEQQASCLVAAGAHVSDLLI